MNEKRPVIHVVENSIESDGIIEKAEEIKADLIFSWDDRK